MNFLDSNLFKAFYWASKELNFTSAAKKAGMTQSGISQHINRLEEQLEVSLFERVNKQVFLTAAGESLLKYVEEQSEGLVALKEEIYGDKFHESGHVRYAMPHSCLFTPHFPLLLDKNKQNENIHLDVKLCPNEEVFRLLLNKEIDFGFVTKMSKLTSISYEKFAREEYIMVGSPLLAQKIKIEADPKCILNLPFVDYPGMEALFYLWAETLFPESRLLNFHDIKVTGSINNLHGAIEMLLAGVGYSILPSHCVQAHLDNGNLVNLSPRKELESFSDIYIVTLENTFLSNRVKKIIEYFREMK